MSENRGTNTIESVVSQTTTGHADETEPSAALAVGPARRRWTRKDYYCMAEAEVFGPNDRVELIEGEIIQMPPQNPAHSTGVRAAETRLRALLGRAFEVRSLLPLTLGATSEPEPDVAVVPGTTLDYRTEHPSTALLVVEVSDATLQLDQTMKASLYASAGIQEYWILNILERTLEVYREPRPDPDQPCGHGYFLVTSLSCNDSVTPLIEPDTLIPVSSLII